MYESWLLSWHSALIWVLINEVIISEVSYESTPKVTRKKRKKIKKN